MDIHKSVLVREAVDALALGERMTVVDATLGSGGHAQVILKHLGAKGTLIGIDADRAAIEAAEELKEHDATVHLVAGNFRDIGSILDGLEIKRVDAILADLGWRTEQFEESGKGFSFQHDEPLIMTYGEPAAYPFTARDIVNDWSEESIANVLYGYGEERKARKIAKTVVMARANAPIETTQELVGIIESVKGRRGKIHPATQTFQALRIAVNDELRALEEFIDSAIERLSTGGTLAIITFHSIEDRLVKTRFRELAKEGRGTIVTKKPIVPARDEVRENPRARSAKLRIFNKYE